MTKLIRISLLSVFILFIVADFNCLNAQASLSIQGILKKSNGLAVDDGSYKITFKLYESETGSTSIWSETQDDVEVFNGIYSAILGQVNVLNVPFDKLYYLGVTIGATELSPRILLTSAPYALSLIGSTNQFPSSGEITADGAKINGTMKAKVGSPVGSGYAFDGDEDTGVFSTGDGRVSLYSNNVEKLVVTPTTVQVLADFNTDGVNLTNNGSISYGGEKDWRLVETNDFNNNNAEGWQVYDKLSGYSMGWNNPNSLGAAPTQDMGSFIGSVLLPISNDHVLKKQFTPSGSFTQIKVKFRYYFIDSWDWSSRDRAWAAFSANASGSAVKVGWHQIAYFLNDFNDDFTDGTTPFFQNANFYGDSDYADYWLDAEMTAKSDGNSFWIFIGAAVDHSVTDERYAIGAVEIYVK